MERIFFRLVMKRSIETNSSSLKADAWHHRSDAITSVAALDYWDCFINGQRYESADDWAALFALVLFVTIATVFF
jgi:divalent metal cation (Fe/Co/Zn/Cd) transporter